MIIYDSILMYIYILINNVWIWMACQNMSKKMGRSLFPSVSVARAFDTASRGSPFTSFSWSRGMQLPPRCRPQETSSVQKLYSIVQYVLVLIRWRRGIHKVSAPLKHKTAPLVNSTVRENGGMLADQMFTFRCVVSNNLSPDLSEYQAGKQSKVQAAAQLNSCFHFRWAV